MALARLIPIGAGLVLAAGLAGCGDEAGNVEGADKGPAQRSGGGAAQSGGGGTVAQGVVQVAMKDIKFIPANITVKVGQQINWTNEDQVPHTATTTKGEKFDSGNVPPGESFKYTLRNRGKIDYFCKIHPQQKGTITITEK